MKFKCDLFVAVLTISVLMLSACQKAQEPAKPKTEVAQAVKQKTQPQPQQLVETQLEKKASLPQDKFRQITSTSPNAAIATPNPLTEEEQKYFDKIGGDIITPDLFEGYDVNKYLGILLKGSPETIRWYQENINNKKDRDKEYGQTIVDTISELNLKKDKEAFKLALEVLKTKRAYPEAVAGVAFQLKYAHDPSVIPLLQDLSSDPDQMVELSAAASLLALGDADTALPLLSKLAQEGNVGGVEYLFKDRGQLWDERGLKIVEEALDNPTAEVAITAARLLTEMGKDKEKCEKVAIGILKQYIHKTKKDYGFEVIGGPSNPQWVLLPKYKDKTLEEVEAPFYSDMRACSYAMSLLGDLKSKKAIPLLKNIKENNTNSNYVCWENRADKSAEHALNKIMSGENN